jgi:hypothetical protein
MNIKQDAPKITQHTVAALNNINTIRIDANVTPIYPVRYAYANFFEAELAHAQNPPTISTLLNSNNLNDNDGYLLRILREGWVYIREEDDLENGHFHIFKYEQVKHNNSITEKFTKYLFKNKLNAQEGLIVDHSNTNSTYPFAFVRNGIKEISIVYSEHEFHPDVIDKLNGSEDERKECMQRVNLDMDSDDYAVPASQENLAKLVEDYRERKNRVLALKESEINSEIKELALDVLTAEMSYELEPESVATELQQKIDYGEEARMVALFDPVGRQKEIANAHLKLVLWEKEYAASTVYPYTIGKMVKDFRNAEDEGIKEIVEESINWSAHDEHWGEMDGTFQEFKARQEQFADIYTRFMMHGEHVSIPGSLDTYFKKFFCDHVQTSDDANTELQKLCNVSADIFAGVMSSEAFRKHMAVIINNAAESEDKETSPSALFIIWDGIERSITTPQESVSWEKTTKLAFDGFLNGLAGLIGKVHAESVYRSGKAQEAGIKYTSKALDLVANKVVPNMMTIFGLEVAEGGRVRLTVDEIAEVLSDIINQHGSASLKSANFIVDKALAKKALGQKAFDWAEKTKNSTIPELDIKLEVPVMKPNADFKFSQQLTSLGSPFAIGVDTSFTGLSIVLNMQTIFGFIYQTESAELDPVIKQNMAIECTRFTSALFALSYDLIQVGGVVSNKLSSSSSVITATRLAPSLASKSRIATNLVKAIPAKIAAWANVFGMVASGWDAYNAFEEGNTVEGWGHVSLVVGSAMLAGQMFYFAGAAAAGAAGGTSWTGVGAIVFGAVSLLFIGIGAAVAYAYGKTRFQKLLEGSFWGEGPKHLFLNDQERTPDFTELLDDVMDLDSEMVFRAYKQELQEFQNILYQPNLSIETDHDFSEMTLRRLPTRYTYKFTLPAFQMNASNLHVEIHREFERSDGITRSKMDYQLTQNFKGALKNSDIKIKGGVANFEVYIEMPEMVDIFWYYEPTPNFKVPMRSISEDGELQKQVLGMLNEEAI